MLTYKGSLSLSALLVPLFALFASVLFELSIQLTAMLQLSLSLGISIALPTIAIAITIVAALIVSFNLALELDLPSFNLNLSLALDFELVLVLGFIATLEALINAIAEASLVAYGWFGSAQALGATLSSQLAQAWPDGTASDAPITAYLFVATSSGPYSKDQIASIGMMPKPSPPPTPQHPPPPDGSYPPPQAYETGLAGLSISAPTEPGGVQATGTVTVDDSISMGIGAITGISIVEHGSGYTAPPTVMVTDTVNIVSIASATPVVLTLPNALTIPVASGLALTLAGIEPKDLNGQYCAKVLSPTTVALYKDSDFTQPVSGSGTGGTATGSGTGAAALVTMGGGAVNALQSLLDGLEWPTSTALVGGVITFKAMLATMFGLILDLDGNLQARAKLLGGVKLGVDFLPPSVAASLDLLAKISANLKANLNVKLPDLTVSVGAALTAQINAIASLVARIGFFLGLAADGITLEIYEYQGPGSGLGAAISSGPGSVGWNDRTPATTSVTAAVFGLTNPASMTAFSAIFSGATA